jgi:hypothetical protein
MSKLDVNDRENDTQEDANAANNNVRNAQKVVLATCPRCCTDYKMLFAIEILHRIV